MDVNQVGPGQESTADALYGVIRHVRPLHRALARAVEEGLAGSHVTVAIRAVMEQLAEAGPVTVPEVGRALDLPRQFVQRLTNQATELGLVRKRPNPAHRRSPLIELTDEGARELRRIRAREQAVLREVAADLDPHDIRACLRVLGHLHAAFRQANEHATEQEGATT